MKSSKIIGFNIKFTDKDEEYDIFLSKKQGYYIFANSNTLVEAKYNILLNTSLKKANLILPDGYPLVFVARLKGLKKISRIAGPDFTLSALNYLEKNKITCCFYGGNQEESKIREILFRKRFPKLSFHSFPEKREIEMMNSMKNKKIDYIFVSLGSPKQEIWAYKNYKKIKAKIFCVGVALPYILGEKKRAPKLIQKIYLEWLYRLITEPVKSWKRYLINGPKFAVLSLNELLSI